MRHFLGKSVSAVVLTLALAISTGGASAESGALVSILDGKVVSISSESEVEPGAARIGVTPASATLPPETAAKVRANSVPVKENASASGDTEGTVTILTEGFEGAWPTGSWQAFDNTASSKPYWDNLTAKPRTSTHSAYCVGTLGSAQVNYPDDLSSWAIYGPFSLTDASAAEVDLWRWNNTESGVDFLVWMASTNGTNFSGWQTSGNSGGWVNEVFDLTTVPAYGDLTGESQVWIALMFTSDFSNPSNYEGAYVDDLVIRKTTADNIDLQITAVSGSCNPDGTLAISVTTLNAGADAAGAFETGVYLSTNATITVADTRIAFGSIASLAGGASIDSMGDVNVAAMPTGTYYIGGIADDLTDIPETNESNNALAGAQLSLPCGGPPDIRVEPLVIYANGNATPSPVPTSVPTAKVAESRGPLFVNPARAENDKIIEPDGFVETFAQGADTVKVIVNLKPPLAIMEAMNWENGSDLAALKATNRPTIDTVLKGVGAGECKVRHRYELLCGFSATVTWDGLMALAKRPDVASIEPVRVIEPHLAQGIPLMNASIARSTYNGQGLAVAICDTGIDYMHPKLGGAALGVNTKVLGGYDYGDNDADPIPGGNAHGTACAGIVAGAIGTVGDYIGGVAHGAKLYALKMSSGSSGSAEHDAMVASWQWCVTNKNLNPSYPIMVISTSFGGGRYYAACNTASNMMTNAAAAAKAAGITVVVSSGNDGYCDSIGWPACITHAISVGAVYDANFGNYLPCVDAASCAAPKVPSSCTTGWHVVDATSPDMVTSYSNTASFLDILGPSNAAYTTDISGPGGYSDPGDYAPSFGGTSAACPYVAGAAACLQSAAMAQQGAFLTPDQVQQKITSTGDLITDGKIAITKPRVNLGAAVGTLAPAMPGYFTVHNDGAGLLYVSDIDQIQGDLWLAKWSPDPPFIVAPGGSQRVTIDIAPALGSPPDWDQLLVYSTDPDETPYPGGVFVNLSTAPPVGINDVRDHILGRIVLAEPHRTNADTNGDGKIDILDYMALELLGW